MNQRVLGWAAAALLACSLSVCAQATAQPPASKPSTPSAPPPSIPAQTTGNLAAGGAMSPSGGGKVATVHIQQAIANCAEGKKATDDLQKRFEPKKAQLEAMTKSIQEKQQRLQQGEKVLSEEQKNQLIREIDRETKNFNHENEEATADYQQAVDGVFNGIGNKMLQVIAVYAQKNGFDLVLNSAQPGEVLWQNDRVDITQEVIGAYNMSFPSNGMTAPPAAPGAKPPASTAPKKP
jgi:Skp family chaperone for outer membrane proteins